MDATRKHLIARIVFVATFAACAALALLGGAHAQTREPATIILFVPLLWGFMVLRPPGMIAIGLIAACLRVMVEALQVNGAMPAALNEAISPIGLYLVLGLMFYLYRRRQDMLVSRLVESTTNEARDRLTTSLAHDFNNILTVIVGTSDLMLRDKELAPQFRRDIEVIQNAGQQGAALITQLRSATRPSAEGRTPQDLSALVDKQLELVRRILPPTIHVVRRSEGRLPVMVDRGQILRVLMNLCFNARDAMGSSGMLTVHTGRRDVDGRPHATLTVSDTGAGIDPSVLGRIFEPFFSTRHEQGGVGLGLTIVKSIAASHDGFIEVQNIPNAGASFTLCIPVAT